MSSSSLRRTTYPYGREIGVIGPGQLEGDAVPDRSQAVEALELRELVGEAHVVELAHRARRETVATRLLAREALLVDHHDAVPERREPVGGGRSRRSGAYHEHVELPVDSVAGSLTTP